MADIKACIFDLDGVIVDTAKYHFLAWQRLGKELGIPFDEEQNEQLKGVSRRKSIEKILDWGDKSLPEEEILALMDKKNGWYQEYIYEMGPDEILDGVMDFMRELKKRDVKIAVGSASRNTPIILEQIDLSDYFDAVVDGNMVEKTKPDPEVFLKAAYAMGTIPATTVVFEDALHGVEAANRAGMISIGVGDEETLGGADLVIPGFQDFTVDDLFKKFSEN